MAHARPEVLKAAALSIPFVRVVESVLQPSPAVGFLRGHIDAMIATAPGHAGGIGEFVSDALQHLRSQKALAIAPTFTAQELQQFDDFSELLAARIAQNSSPAVTATQGGAALYAAEAPMVIDLQEAFDFAQELGAGILAQESLPLPALTNSTSGGGTISASCRHTDTAGVHTDEVTLVLPQLGFNRINLFEAPYLLAHETLCHAGQGVLVAKNRKGSGASCPWTDAWMDCVAFDACRGWLRGTPPGPSWISAVNSAIDLAAERAHVARYNRPPVDKTDEAILISWNHAKEAWIGLANGAAEVLGDSAEALVLRRAFSLLYNAFPRTQDERESMVYGLYLGLARDNPNRSAAVAEIQAFVLSRDIARVQAYFDSL